MSSVNAADFYDFAKLFAGFGIFFMQLGFA